MKRVKIKKSDEKVEVTEEDELTFSCKNGRRN